jgi:hypothetical protein
VRSGEFALTVAAGRDILSFVERNLPDPVRAMNAITVQLASDTEKKLRQQAEQAGQTLELYLQQLTERAVVNGTTEVTGAESKQEPRYISDPNPTGSEVERLLRQLAAGSPLPILPADFSRADIYDDHD